MSPTENSRSTIYKLTIHNFWPGTPWYDYKYKSGCTVILNVYFIAHQSHAKNIISISSQRIEMQHIGCGSAIFGTQRWCATKYKSGFTISLWNQYDVQCVHRLRQPTSLWSAGYIRYKAASFQKGIDQCFSKLIPGTLWVPLGWSKLTHTSM